MKPPSRHHVGLLHTAGLILVALVAMSCAAGSSRVDLAGPQPVPLDQVPSTPRESGPSALADPAAPGLPKPLVDPAEILPGGPPPDGIPPIDRPKFVRAMHADWLDGREPVLVLEVEGESRAYPVQVLIWHEIVNDTVGGVPVTVTYCPLCNSAVAYDRRVGERVLDFGTSGRLYNSALVMYDRQTESLWSHFTGQAIAGRLAGQPLEVLPVTTVSWSSWRRANPKGWVLSRDTGFARDYGRNPYTGYDDPRGRPHLFGKEADPRMPPQTRIVGIRGREAAKAVVLESLLKDGVEELTLDGQPLVVLARRGAASSLDAPRIAEGRDVGETGVFSSVVDQRPLSFKADRELFLDQETGTRWDILGRAVSGPLTGHQLKPIEHIDTFWFAWAAFLPHTEVVR